MSDGERKRLIRLIHVGKRALKLSDDEYRALLQGATAGLDSCKDMNLGHLRAVYGALKRRGFKPTPKGGGKGRSPSIQPPPKKTQLSKIWALWFALGKTGGISDTRRAALEAFVKRQTGLDRLELLNTQPKEANKVIEALKAMQRRHGS